MPETIVRNKLMFWAFFTAFLALAAVPSIVLVETLENYFRFLSGWDPGALKAVQVRHLPHRGASAAHGAAEVHFVEFAFHAPKAKRVLLAGDFNRWEPETLPLSPAEKGSWRTVVPLPAGKYQYLFQVDGAWLQDPKSPKSGRRGGMAVSVKQVP